MEQYDYIIIGAGPAGYASAVYAARYMIKTLLIGREPGGYAALAHKICNFPTYKEISGAELSQKMQEQVSALDVPIVNDEVVDITRKRKGFAVTIRGNKQYLASNLLLAVGTQRSKLNIPGEEEYLGRGVSYCATCDAPFFKGKTVAVIGGSDAAITASLLLAEYATNVILVHKNKDFSENADPTWVKSVRENPKIKIMANEAPVKIIGNNAVNGLELANGKTISVGGVFIEVGAVPNSSLLSKLKVKSKGGFIIVNKEQQTNVKGICAAGDVTDSEPRQIIHAASQGARAAYSVYKRIKNKK